MKIRPFKIAVDERELVELRRRLEQTRCPAHVGGAGWSSQRCASKVDALNSLYRPEGNMAAYLIANIEVTDPQSYEDYRRRVPALISAYGGRYLARGGTVERLEGDATPQRVVVLEFPNMAQLKAFYESLEYRPLIALRQRSSHSSLYAVEGL